MAAPPSTAPVYINARGRIGSGSADGMPSQPPSPPVATIVRRGGALHISDYYAEGNS
jgi:hypothetical protein